MRKILEDEGILLLESGGKYFLQYDAGELMIKIKNLLISSDEAQAVMKKPALSYDIIIDHQDRGDFGIDANLEII